MLVARHRSERVDILASDQDAIKKFVAANDLINRSGTHAQFSIGCEEIAVISYAS